MSWLVSALLSLPNLSQNIPPLVPNSRAWQSMCLLSLLAKRYYYEDLWLLWLLFFLQNLRGTQRCLGRCLKYGLEWPILCLLLLCANILSLYPLEHSLKYSCARVMACRLGFMPSRLGSVQNRRHARAMVSLPLFCANIPSLYLLDLLSPISLRSSQNTEWNSYVGFSAQNCRPQTDVLFCFFPAQIYHLSALLTSF